MRFMLYCFICVVSLSYQKVSVRAEELSSCPEPFLIQSAQAEYDGKEMIFLGKVVLQHPMGEVTAHRISCLMPLKKEKRCKFSVINVEDHVQISCYNGKGDFFCQKAYIDYTQCKGIFTGNSDEPLVIYSCQVEGKIPLLIKGTEIIASLINESPNSSRMVVKQIEVNGNVQVNYCQNYVLESDQAVYLNVFSEIPGQLRFIKKQKPCCLRSLQGDEIHAESIQLDTSNRKIYLESPTGVLYFAKEESSQKINFKAQRLIWNEETQVLSLEGDVQIIYNDFFQVTTADQLMITQKMSNGKKILQFIEAPKETTITYEDSEKQSSYLAYCPGKLFIDHLQKEMILDKNSIDTHENSQIYMKSTIGEVYADHIFINYAGENLQMRLHKMEIEGDVSLLNHFAGYVEGSESVSQHALADKIEYFPQQEEIFLTAYAPKRVLLVDKVNHCQMSAPALKIKKNAITNKEIIQGIGDVRFTFLEKELEQIKQHFK